MEDPIVIQDRKFKSLNRQSLSNEEKLEIAEFVGKYKKVYDAEVESLIKGQTYFDRRRGKHHAKETTLGLSCESCP